MVADGYIKAAAVIAFFSVVLWFAFLVQIVIQIRVKRFNRAKLLLSVSPDAVNARPNPKLRSPSVSGGGSGDGGVELTKPTLVLSNSKPSIVADDIQSQHAQYDQSTIRSTTAPQRPPALIASDLNEYSASHLPLDVETPSASPLVITVLPPNVEAPSPSTVTSAAPLMGSAITPSSSSPALAPADGAKRNSVSSRVRVPVVGSLQRYLHPIGFTIQCLQVIASLDPFEVFGILGFRGHTTLTNIVTFLIVLMGAITTHDFLRLRYVAVLKSMPSWVPPLFVSTMSVYCLVVASVIIHRLVTGEELYAVTIIDYIFILIEEAVILTTFLICVVDLTKFIRTMKESRGESHYASFAGAVRRMQGFAISTCIVVGLVMVGQMQATVKIAGKLKETRSPINPDDASDGLWLLMPQTILQLLVVATGLYFTHLPVQALFASFESSRVSREPKRSRGSGKA